LLLPYFELSFNVLSRKPIVLRSNIGEEDLKSRFPTCLIKRICSVINDLRHKHIFVITTQIGCQFAKKVGILSPNARAYPVLFGVDNL
jgi:hypothetical protein